MLAVVPYVGDNVTLPVNAPPAEIPLEPFTVVEAGTKRFVEANGPRTDTHELFLIAHTLVLSAGAVSSAAAP